MQSADSANKALLWDVLLQTGFFELLSDDDYTGVRNALDMFVSLPCHSEMTLLDANKSVIEKMHSYLTKLRAANKDERDTSANCESSSKTYQRSSTI
tara:strand:- start:11660 stop:11950 length:291 start_codon:yes stop_codon:yes gene_type:complete